jgi:hypothetical protein
MPIDLETLKAAYTKWVEEGLAEFQKEDGGQAYTFSENIIFSILLTIFLKFLSFSVFKEIRWEA